MIDFLRTNNFPTFRFLVLINNVPFGVFTECTLPIVEWEMKEVKEGGLNTHTHQLPGYRKKTKIVLKNGVGHSLLVDWYIMTMQGYFRRSSVTIMLLNSLKFPMNTWYIEDALPMKWSGPQLKSGDNTVAVQSLELVCGEVTIAPTPSFF